MMEYKNTGAVYEVRTYGSVRGMGQKPHPTRCFRMFIDGIVISSGLNFAVNCSARQ